MERRLSILERLPDVFRRAAIPGAPLSALVEVMEEMRRPIVERLDTLEDAFDPARAEPPLLHELARWVGIPPEHAVDTAALRDLVRASAELARRRGTASALARYLELACRAEGFRVREATERPFHVIVEVPPGASSQEARVRAIVEREKPAHVSFSIESAEP